MSTTSSSFGAIKPPWIGIFPVRTPAHVRQGTNSGTRDNHQDSSQLLFETKTVHSSTAHHQSSSSQPPQLFIVMQEVPSEIVLSSEGNEKATTLPSETVVPPTKVKSEIPLAPPMDKTFDISLLKLDHITAAFASSEQKSAGGGDGRQGNCSFNDPLDQFLDRNREWNGRGLGETDKPPTTCSTVERIQLPICIVWRGRTTLSKMCPIEIQSALATSSSGSELPTSGFLRAYKVLVEEILMNKVNPKTQPTAKNTTSLTDSVADGIVADVNEVVSQQRHACKRQTSLEGGTGGAPTVDPLFHLKSEVEEDNRHNTEAGGGEFIDFLRDHGIPLPVGRPGDILVDPLTTLLKHAYGFARMSRPAPKAENTSSANNPLPSEQQQPLKRSFSSSGVAGPSPIQESVTAMRRHRYAFLKNTLGIIGDRGDGDGASCPGLVFSVSPEEILHSSLHSDQRSSLRTAVNSLLPSVVSVEVRIAAMDGLSGGGMSSSSSSFPSYLPFATMHCFLDDSHKRQLSCQDKTKSDNLPDETQLKTFSRQQLLRHPLAGFLNMLCGSFLHHNQLSDEIIPILLETQKRLLASCFLPVANSSLQREADLLLAFEEILNTKKSKIRELVEHGRRSQRRVEDLEAVVAQLKGRIVSLEGASHLEIGHQPPEDTQSSSEIVEEEAVLVEENVPSVVVSEKTKTPQNPPANETLTKAPLGTKRPREITDDWLTEDCPHNADDETLSLLN